MLTATFCSGFGAASGSHFLVEVVGEVSEDEENFGNYQKERLDDANDGNDIWTMDDHMNFALDAEAHLDDEELDHNNAARDESEKGESGDDIAWEYEIGARKAKNKKPRETKDR